MGVRKVMVEKKKKKRLVKSLLAANKVKGKQKMEKVDDSVYVRR